MGRHIFKPIKPLKLGGNRNNYDLIKILTLKLSSIEIKDPSSSKDQVNFLSGSETSSIVSRQLIEISHNSEQEEEQINKLKTWHQRSKFFIKDLLLQIFNLRKDKHTKIIITTVTSILGI